MGTFTRGSRAGGCRDTISVSLLPFFPPSVSHLVLASSTHIHSQRSILLPNAVAAALAPKVFHSRARPPSSVLGSVTVSSRLNRGGASAQESFEYTAPIVGALGGFDGN